MEQKHTKGLVPATQTDRDAAADIQAYINGPDVDLMRKGGMDGHVLVQAFAKHRTAVDQFPCPLKLHGVRAVGHRLVTLGPHTGHTVQDIAYCASAEIAEALARATTSQDTVS